MTKILKPIEPIVEVTRPGATVAEQILDLPVYSVIRITGTFRSVSQSSVILQRTGFDGWLSTSHVFVRDYYADRRWGGQPDRYLHNRDIQKIIDERGGDAAIVEVLAEGPAVIR